MKEELTLEQKATNCETLKHIRLVQSFLHRFASALLARGDEHDESKLHSPEVEVFTEVTAKLSGMTYGSEDYKKSLKDMGPALHHHYSSNSHHPEHYSWHCPVCNLQIDDKSYNEAPQGPNESQARYCPKCCRNGMLYESELMFKPELGINGMDLLDIVELFCDWKAATMRHHDGSLAKSVEHNSSRFNLGPVLTNIFRNTIEFMEK